MTDISIVVPVFNERESLEELVAKIRSTVDEATSIEAWEIIFVDDGSTDGSWQTIDILASETANILGLRMRRNFGKATALSAGVRRARYPVLFTMDADLQDDPSEMPRFLQKLEEGYDLVSGWKQIRCDPIMKRLPSRLFNATARWITGVKLNDMNCGFKVYRREVLDQVDVYGELHRYIPAIAFGFGFRIGELAVKHFPRRHGYSKYGFERYARGFLDLLTTVAITRYQQKPGHLFGGVGLTIAGLGVLLLTYLTALKVFLGESLGDRPALMLGVMMTIIGVQFLLFGLLAELLVARTQHNPVERLIMSETKRKDS